VLALTTVWLEKHHVGAQGEEWGFSFVERCLIAGRALWFYAGKLFWPHKLIFIYPRWQIDAGVWWQYPFPLAAVVVFIALWLFRRQIGKAPLTAVLFFAGTLAPALGFFDIYPMRYSFVADHFQYLASIGLIVLCIAVIMKVFLQRIPSYRNSGFAVFGVVILTLGILVWQQGHTYKDVEMLWRNTISKNPNAWMAYNNLANVLKKQGKLEDVIKHYKKALAINPNFAGGYNNLGNIYRKKGMVDEAILEYQKAIAIDPNLAEAHNNLGFTYNNKGMLDEAISEHKKALAINPNYTKAYNNLCVAYGKKGRLDEAISECKKALSINPNYVEAHYNLSVNYYNKGNYKLAIIYCDKAIELRGSVNPKLLELLKPHR